MTLRQFFDTQDLYVETDVRDRNGIGIYSWGCEDLDADRYGSEVMSVEEDPEGGETAIVIIDYDYMAEIEQENAKYQAEKRLPIMDAREIAEKLYEMSMDMDWMDYEDTREGTIRTLTKEIENAGENLRNILCRIVPED